MISPRRLRLFLLIMVAPEVVSPKIMETDCITLYHKNLSAASPSAPSGSFVYPKKGVSLLPGKRQDAKRNSKDEGWCQFSSCSSGHRGLHFESDGNLRRKQFHCFKKINTGNFRDGTRILSQIAISREAEGGYNVFMAQHLFEP